MEKKLAGIYVLVVLIFTGMICRFYTLAMGDALASAANTQSAFVLDVDNTRGIIYDCNMNPMVSTQKRTVAAVQPMPESNTALMEAMRKNGEKITFDPQAVQPYTLTLEKGDIYAKGIENFDTYQRYASEQLAPHIIGYLNAEKTKGISGIELSYDKQLKKYDGSLKVRYQIDAIGRTMTEQTPQIMKENYRNDGGVVLTLDSDIQRGTEKAMKNVSKGAAVVMDVSTGNIKASVSMPAYDQNNLAASLKDPNCPFVNRAFSQYNVGSTFKLVTAAAALESGYGRYAPFICKGVTEVDGHAFYCHWRSGHGEIDLKKAIEVSCNPFFIHMGLTAGGRKITSLAREIGFTRSAHFTDDMITQSGTLPSANELKNNTAVANLSFGQGSLTATPIQIAQMISTVANGGYALTPRIVEGFTDDGDNIYEHTTIYAPTRVFSERTSHILRECMVANVEEGSGIAAKPLRGTAGGKTASAQTGIYRIPGEEDSEIVHAWFAGYYPADNPQYAIVVLVEGGESGSDVAAPIFKKIADEIYLSQI